MKSIQEAYNSIYNKQDIQEDVVYEEVDVCEEAYQILIEGGMSDDDATEVVNYIYDHREDLAEVDAQLQENKGALAGQLGLTLLGGAARMLGLLPKKKAVQAVLKRMPTPKVPSKLPSMQFAKRANQTLGPQNATGVTQPNFLTKSGQLNQFFDVTNKKGQPWMVKLDPVRPGRSTLPQGYFPARPAAEVPGQMRIPGMSDRAMELSRITGQPMGGPLGLSMSGGSNKFRNQSIFKGQPTRTAPSLPQTPASPAKPGVDMGAVKDALAKTALASGVVGVPAGMYYGGRDNTASITKAQQNTKLAQQRAETQAAMQPQSSEPETGERSYAANVDKQERAKQRANGQRVSAETLSKSAKDFDNAFARARSAGKSEFTWRGRTYNTRLG